VTPDDQAARYRRATEAALDQMEWCINYLHAIRKTDIAKALSRNRDRIRRRMRTSASGR
jgi:hypothetical protein